MNEICPDLEKFKDGWVKGFTNHEIGYGSAMFVIILMLAAWQVLFSGFPVMAAIFISIWIALPVGFQGFYQVNGMSMVEVLVRYINLMDDTCYFVSDEGDVPYAEEDKGKGVTSHEHTGRSKKGHARGFKRHGKKKDYRPEASAKTSPGNCADTADSAERDI